MAPKRAGRAPRPAPRDADRVVIFDTTLRDGEQCPGASLNADEKMTIARQLARLGVDVIEAGFPISSPGDFESVKRIAAEVGTPDGPVVCGLARAVPADIETAGKAIAPAAKGRIHTFIATSPIHMERKLKKTPAQVLEAAVEAVRLAKTFTDDVEWSAEDAGRSDVAFLCEIVEAAIEAGATTINIPDTVGYQTPFEFGRIIATLKEKVPKIERCVLSVHCHDDLGLAVANSLAGVRFGARQIECTINGIGERAGNCSLEEVVMALEVRRDTFGVKTGIRTEEIYKTSRLVSGLTGFVVPPNKAIVGANAFAHEAGIHQDGVLKHQQTYEIMRPEQVGVPRSELVLGKHSGRHAFVRRLKDLGIDLPEAAVDRAFERFKRLADAKKVVYDEDLEALVEDEAQEAGADVWRLEYLQVTSGTAIPTATVRLVKDGTARQEAAVGDGPVDATYAAIDRIVGLECALVDYQIKSVTKGQDALGEAMVVVEAEGKRVTGRAASTDVVEASARAYLHALNRHIRGAGKRRAGEAPRGI